MNTVLIGVLSFVVLLILVFLHMPISIVMVVVGTIGYALVVNLKLPLLSWERILLTMLLFIRSVLSPCSC
jgi:hypothetical protein